MWYLRLFVLLAACLGALYEWLKPEYYSFLDYANLIFHEAGHVLFIPFGWTLTILGGSIMQVLVPASLAVYFFYAQKDKLASSLCIFWSAQSLVGVAVYAKDARERMLPLITDDIDTHDWWQVLSHYNLLQYDNAIGNMLMFLALLLILFGVYVAYLALAKSTTSKAQPEFVYHVPKDKH